MASIAKYWSDSNDSRNGLDFVFIFMFVLYLPLRVVGLQIDHEASATEALSILSKHACQAFFQTLTVSGFSLCWLRTLPSVGLNRWMHERGSLSESSFAFVTLSDNLLVLSLRSMLAQFSRLMFLAIWCFAGFLVAFVTLGGGKYRPGEILQWMIWIWFGLDSTGLQRANHLHNTLGPVLMVIYACLSNTLIITILVAILSNTFNILNEDALAEQMYRRAVTVRTLSGLCDKADATTVHRPFKMLSRTVSLRAASETGSKLTRMEYIQLQAFSAFNRP